MSQQLKKLNAEQIQKLIGTLDRSLTEVRKNSERPYPECYAAIGYADATIEHVIKQLKGEWPL